VPCNALKETRHDVVVDRLCGDARVLRRSTQQARDAVVLAEETLLDALTSADLRGSSAG
jgi:hypothetical protein